MRTLKIQDLKIEQERKLINWPLGEPLDPDTVIRAAHLVVKDEKGNVLAGTQSLDAREVDTHQEGHYPAILVFQPDQVEFASEFSNGPITKQSRLTQVIEIDVLKNAEKPVLVNHDKLSTSPTKASPTSSQQAKNSHQRAKWLVIVLLILVAVLSLFALRSCQHQRQQAQEASSQQSSINSANSSSISSLQDDNQQAKQQVAQLKDAIREYQRDQDRDELTNQLNELQQQNQRIEQENNDLKIKNKLTLEAMDQAIPHIINHPDDAAKIMDEMGLQ